MFCLSYTRTLLWINLHYLRSKKLERQKSTTALLAGATFILILAFIALQVYVSQGGIHEEKNVKRHGFQNWFNRVMTAVSYYLNRKTINSNNQNN